MVLMWSDLPLTIAGSAHNALDNSCSNLVFDRLLIVTSRSDKELILDIHEVLAVLNNFTVSILDGVLGRDVMAPLGRAACDLAICTSPLGTVLGMRLGLVLLLLLAFLVLSVTTKPLLGSVVKLLAEASLATKSTFPLFAVVFATKSTLSLTLVAVEASLGVWRI